MSTFVNFLVLGLVAGFLSQSPTPRDVHDAGAIENLPSFRPAATVLTSVLDDGAAPSKTVALTFDDGPDPHWTPMLLDALLRHGAVATFCVVGTEAAAHPEIVQQVVASGMRLCNHSWSHNEELAHQSDPEMVSDVNGVQLHLQSQGLPAPAYFRAPAGVWSPALIQAALRSGMQPLGWETDPRDWRQAGVESITSRIMAQVRPGAILLLHDGGGDRKQTIAALNEVLPSLKSQGYRFAFPTP